MTATAPTAPTAPTATTPTADEARTRAWRDWLQRVWSDDATAPTADLTEEKGAAPEDQTVAAVEVRDGGAAPPS